MLYLFLLLIITIALYLFISIKTKSFINGLLFYFGGLIIFDCILPILYLFMVNKGGYSYYYIFVYNLFFIISLSSGYFIVVKKNITFNLSINLSNEKIHRIIKIILIILCLYLLILYISIDKSYFINPRLLYEKARVGYGHIYFVVVALINLYFIFSLFYNKKKYYFLIVFCLLYFTGSKARMLIPVELSILYYFYVYKKNRYNIKNLFIISILLIVLLNFSFALTSSYLRGKGFFAIMSALANYSDYSRNFLLLIDKLTTTHKHFLGLITFENNFYAFIPRAIFKSKPLIFGEYRLSEMVFPELTHMFKGAPSFGRYGSIYADFGHFSLILILTFSFIHGCFIGIAENTLIKSENIITFMIFIVIININIIDVGLDSIIVTIVNLVIVFVFWYIVKIKN